MKNQANEAGGDSAGKKRVDEELIQAKQELSAALELSNRLMADLQQVIEELQQTNEELQQANEELQQSNEELEESNQELTTTRNELEEASRAKITFISCMSHELRTPLGPILGFSELLLTQNKDATSQEFLRLIHSSGRQLLALIEDILDFSKIEIGKIRVEAEAVPLASFLSSSLKFFHDPAEKKGIDLRMNCAADLPEEIQTDPVRLRQILYNLLGNAIKFTERGMVNLIVHCHEKNIIFRVKDTGIGVPMEKQEVIFDPFVQVDASIVRKYGGTGLGLAISRSLAVMLGGTLTLQSELGQGSEFRLCLPCVVPNATVLPSEINAGDSQKTLSPSLRILLVEDDLPNQIMTRQLLLTMQHQVEVASDGSSALLMLKQKNFDVVLLDINLPDLDGKAVCQAIRRQFPADRQPRIVAQTAKSLAGDREECLQAGMDDYLSKPFSRQELFEVLARQINPN